MEAKSSKVPLKRHFCCVPNCFNRCDSGSDAPLNFYNFPLDKIRCKEWVRKARRIDLINKSPEYISLNHLICQAHFDSSQFKDEENQKLKETAVPNVFSLQNKGKISVLKVTASPTKSLANGTKEVKASFKDVQEESKIMNTSNFSTEETDEQPVEGLKYSSDEEENLNKDEYKNNDITLENDVTFRIARGGRDGTRPRLIQSSGYIFLKKTHGKESIIWRCSFRPGSGSGCLATIKQIGNVFHITGREHIHPPRLDVRTAESFKDVQDESEITNISNYQCTTKETDEQPIEDLKDSSYEDTIRDEYENNDITLENDVTFCIVRGGKDGKRPRLIQSSGYIFTKKRDGKESIIWRCAYRPGSGSGCLATVKQVDNVFHITGRKHIHPPRLDVSTADFETMPAAEYKTSRDTPKTYNVQRKRQQPPQMDQNKEKYNDADIHHSPKKRKIDDEVISIKPETNISNPLSGKVNGSENLEAQISVKEERDDDAENEIALGRGRRQRRSNPRLSGDFVYGSSSRSPKKKNNVESTPVQKKTSTATFVWMPGVVHQDQISPVKREVNDDDEHVEHGSTLQPENNALASNKRKKSAKNTATAKPMKTSLGTGLKRKSVRNVVQKTSVRKKSEDDGDENDPFEESQPDCEYRVVIKNENECPLSEVDAEECKKLFKNRRIPDDFILEEEVTYLCLNKGTQRGSKRLLGSDGYTYNLKKKVNYSDRDDWRCTWRPNKGEVCNIIIRQYTDTGKFYRKGEHIHLPKPSAFISSFVSVELKKKAKIDFRTKPREVIETILKDKADLIERHGCKFNINYLIRIFNKNRLEMKRRNPCINDQFSFDDAQGFLQEEIFCKNRRFIIFATDEQRKLLARVDRWYVDITLKFISRPFTQLMSISAFVLTGDTDQQVKLKPLMFVLMNSAEKKDFVKVFRSIVRRLRKPLCVRSFVLDYNKNLWTAVRSLFFNCRLRGCAWKFGQCLWSKIQEFGLKDEQLEHCDQLHRLLKLPFLPPREIPVTFEILQAEFLNLPCFTDLVNYLQSTWIEGHVWPIRSWSVYANTFRTKAEVISWHYSIRLNDKLNYENNIQCLVKDLHKISLSCNAVKPVHQPNVRKYFRGNLKTPQGRIFNLWEDDLVMSHSEFLSQCCELSEPSMEGMVERMVQEYRMYMKEYV